MRDTQQQTAFLILVSFCAQFQGLQAEASPTPRNSQPPKRTSYLISISILVSLLALLFTAKWIFVSRRRRKNNRYQTGKGSIRSPFVWHDDLSTSSMHICNGSMTTRQGGKSAFLVGLLGSPSWETRYAAEEKGSLQPRIANDSPSPSSLHPLKHHSAPRSGQNRHKSFTSHTLHWDSSGHVDGYNIAAWCKDFDLHSPSLAMASGGIKSSRSYDNMANQDYLAWKPDVLSGGHLINPSVLYGPGGAGLGSSRMTLPISHLASTAASIIFPDAALILPPRPDSSPVLVKDLAEDSDEATGASVEQLDCSKANSFTLSRKPVVGVTPYCCPDAMDIVASPSLIPPNLGTPPQGSPRDEIPHTTSHRCSADLAPMKTPKIRLSISSPRDRTVRSLKIGPSPLRTMFLPFESGNVMKCTSNSDIDDSHEWTSRYPDDTGNTQSKQSLLLSGNSPRTINTCLRQGRNPTPTQNNNQSPPSKRLRTSKRVQSNDLVNFLEELVQATSAWDESLFVDDNFKAMIDSSKSHETARPGSQMKGSRSSRKRQLSFIYLEDIPEVDVADITLEEGEEDVRSYWSDEDEFQRTLGTAL